MADFQNTIYCVVYNHKMASLEPHQNCGAKYPPVFWSPLLASCRFSSGGKYHLVFLKPINFLVLVNITLLIFTWEILRLYINFQSLKLLYPNDSSCTLLFLLSEGSSILPKYLIQSSSSSHKVTLKLALSSEELRKIFSNTNTSNSGCFLS